MSGWTFTRPPHVARTLEQRRALDRAVDRLVLSSRERAVLNVLVEHGDGAGYCFLGVERTIVPESGCSEVTVRRALTDLRRSGLVKTFPFKRTDAESPEYLPRRARQGQGASTYRLGRDLRATAGLRDHDPSVWSDPIDDGGNRLGDTPEIRAAGNGDLTAPVIPPVGDTPETAVSPCNLGGVTRSSSPKADTPVTRVTREQARKGGCSSREDPLDQDLSSLIEQARQTQPNTLEDAMSDPAAERGRDDDDAVDWPDTTGLDSEQAILADCQALVDSGLATWVDDGEAAA